MNTKELAEMVRAEEYLISKGYTKQTCEKCKGTGENELHCSLSKCICWSCDGQGFTWQAPMR